ncbi:hypothetical protein AJ80_06787 [Polytolypa hystricis UAMH7299]|uniref:Uncharacterized protein n=1 Tax=Polytolypa hystricis (strain UAMH7299) TaxID=1447883 RepID=A0A2B7XU27_POLH7|nr:hypothetical protein AJ80_06787 [Polytolypa hystricis UAMH7299]
MPDLHTPLNFLVNLDLYNVEKPYAVIVPPENYDDSILTDNLVFETRDVTITDIRGREEEFTLDGAGFVVLHHKTQLPTKHEPGDVMVKDLRDWTVPDLPAYGAHNDVTVDSGPTIVDTQLPAQLKEFTWRSLLPTIEDCPLAVCDFRSIDKDDLIACDRVIPTRAGEVYYLRYNSGQRW